MPTKSEQILALYDGVRSCQEIAAIVGVSDGYVRVVARQRRGHSSEADRRWMQSPAGRRSKKQERLQLRSDPAAWEREKERHRRLYERKRAANYAAEAEKARAYYEANREERLAYARQYYLRRRAAQKHEQHA